MVHAVCCFLLSKGACLGGDSRDAGSAYRNSGGAVDRGRDWTGRHEPSDAEEAGNNHEKPKELHSCHEGQVDVRDCMGDILRVKLLIL